MKTLLLTVFATALTIFSYSQEIDYQKIEAGDYFKMGRYNDAFFIYLDLSRNNSDLKSAFKNASHALYLTKKFRDYRSIRKFELAKSHLRELIELNPTDPNRGQLPKLSVEEADEYLRYALRQETADAKMLYFDKAMQYYQEAINDGSMDDSLEKAIALCRWAKSEIGYSERRTFDGFKE